MEDNNRGPKLSDRQKNALERLKCAIKQAVDEWPNAEKLNQQRMASYSFEHELRWLTKEERNDKDFRLNVLAQHMLSAGSAIVEDKEAFAEAIKYCPEGIGVWYDLGRDSHTWGLVPIPTEVMDKIVTESPEVLGRLPEEVIALNKDSFLKIIGTDRTIIELPAIQKIMEKDKDFEAKLKGKVIENQAQEAEKLKRKNSRKR